MTTPGGVPRSELDAPWVDEKFAAVYKGMEHMAGLDENGRLNAPGPAMAACIGAVAAATHSSGQEHMTQIIREDIVLNPGRKPIAYVNSLMRQFNNFLLRQFGEIKPENATMVAEWIESLQLEEEQAIFRKNSKLGILTQVPDRGWIAHLVGHSRDLDRPLNIADFGGGEGLTAAKLLDGISSYHPFQSIDVFAGTPHNEFRSTGKTVIESQALSYHVQNDYLPVANAVSIDTQPRPQDLDPEEAAQQMLWRLSMYYTHEYWRDPKRIAEMIHWQNHRSPGLHHVQHDVTKPDVTPIRDAVPHVEGFDIILMNFIGYQILEQGIAAAEKTAEELMTKDKNGKPNGIIVFTDQAFVNPKTGGLKLRDEWGPWGTGTFIKDYRDEDPRYVQIIKARDGRMAHVSLLPDIGRLSMANELGLRSMREAVLLAA
jgi:hypothetical protein